MSEIIPTEYCAETIALKKTIESGFIVLSERLTRIKEERMWEGQWSSFSEYLAEMNITDSTATKLITVHKMYVQEYNLDDTLLMQAGWSNLYEIRHMVGGKKKEEVEDFVKQVSLLKRDDTRQMIREQQKPNCEHDWYIDNPEG